jgi:type III secretory pathway component EscT
MSSEVAEIIRTLAESSGLDLGRVGLGFARAVPAVTLVPAFGLKAIPAPLRMTLALSLAVVIAPAVGPALDLVSTPTPWPVLLVHEVARGLPVAVAAAVPLWVASQLGALIDGLRGSSGSVQLPVIEGQTTPLGGLFGLFAGALFLASGGPARVATALLVTRPLETSLVVRVSHDLVAGISLAIAIGAPILAASAVFEVALALVARAATPTNVQVLLSPVRSAGLLLVTALLLDRLAFVLGSLIQR